MLSDFKRPRWRVEEEMQAATVSPVAAEQTRKVAAMAALLLKRDGFFFFFFLTMHCILLACGNALGKALRCHSLEKQV